MIFIDHDIRKSKDEEDYKLILKILQDYKSVEEIRNRVRMNREAVEKIAKEIVNYKISASGDVARARIGNLSAKDYLDFLHNTMINFESEKGSDFNLDHFNKIIFISYLEAAVARSPGKFKELTETISLWFKFLQTVRVLKNTEMSEVTKLYKDLVETY